MLQSLPAWYAVHYYTLWFFVLTFEFSIHWASSLTRVTLKNWICIEQRKPALCIVLERDNNFISICFFLYQFHDECIQQDIFDSLTRLEPACFPCLSLHSSPGYIYLIEGESVEFEMNNPPTHPPTHWPTRNREFLQWRHLTVLSFAVGVVTGVDEETACCWLVCDTCENRDINTLTNAAKYVLFMFDAIIKLHLHASSTTFVFQFTVFLLNL